MSSKKIIGTYVSDNGQDNISYIIYEPNVSSICAIVQISHGMCEYIERYEHFAEFLNQNGILVCGNDHLGHGNSVKTDDDLGFFGEENGWKHLSEDVYKLTQIVKEKYPNIPYFLMGHSMGSFIARLYLTQYGEEINGAIICGTGDGKALSRLGIRASKSIIRLRGARYRSDKLNNLVFGLYNERIKDHTSTFDWISRDTELVKKYEKDKKCNFIFTASGFLDLTSMLGEISKKSWAENVPKDLPIILLSGDADPVGAYGIGVKRVYKALLESQHNNVKMKLYKDARHEIINETNKQEIYEDILNWVNYILSNR